MSNVRYYQAPGSELGNLLEVKNKRSFRQDAANLCFIVVAKIVFDPWTPKNGLRWTAVCAHWPQIPVPQEVLPEPT